MRIFDVEKEDCENEQIFWEKIKEQNTIEKNTLEGRIIKKIKKTNFRKIVVIAEVNVETRQKFMQVQKLKIGWNM